MWIINCPLYVIPHSFERNFNLKRLLPKWNNSLKQFVFLIFMMGSCHSRCPKEVSASRLCWKPSRTSQLSFLSQHGEAPLFPDGSATGGQQIVKKRPPASPKPPATQKRVYSHAGIKFRQCKTTIQTFKHPGLPLHRPAFCVARQGQVGCAIYIRAVLRAPTQQM